MLIRHCTDNQIQNALDAVNATFKNNIRIKRFEHAGRTRQGTPKTIVTLTVHNSHLAGARHATNSDRAISAACWHVHRLFMEALPPSAEVVSTLSMGSKPTTWTHGQPHVDRNIGSIAYPCMASDACYCYGTPLADSPDDILSAQAQQAEAQTATATATA